MGGIIWLVILINIVVGEQTQSKSYVRYRNSIIYLLFQELGTA